MKVLVSGSHGLMGSRLLSQLRSQGHATIPLVRRSAAAAPDDILWDPPRKGPEPAKLEGIDALIHLAGEPLAALRWTEKKKQALRDSRVRATEALVSSLLELKRPPQTVLVASAIGYYGNRGDEILDETSRAGRGFLPDLCREWEAASVPLIHHKVRLVHLRFGLVLAREGGALASMLPPFRFGLGGPIGPGTQFMSWIALKDVLAAILHALNNDSLSGALNMVSPTPVTNAVFAQTLGSVLRRPAKLAFPAAAARLLLGEMADALLLSSARVEPRRLLNAGFQFSYPHLAGALSDVLHSPS